MTWSPSVFSVLAFSATVILGAWAVIGARRKENEAPPFVLLMVSLSLWAALYGIQLGFSTAAEQLPWQRATLAVSGTIPVLLLLFAQQYAGARGRRTRWIHGLLVIEGVVFAGLALTNPAHQLVWSEQTLLTSSVAPVLELEFAEGYFLHIVVAYGTVTVALWTILSVYFRSPTLYRRQAGLLLAGATPAFATHVLYTVGAGPIRGLDLTPLMFTITGVTFGLALFHFDLLERTPVAQRQAIELTGDGLLVVDADGAIVNANEVAKQIFDVDDGGDATTVSLSCGSDPRDLAGTTLRRTIDGTERVYDVHVTDLTEGLGLHAGSSVVLRDVTDRDTYQQRLEVTNRVLRHNLRNDMTVVLGRAELLADSVPSADQRRLAETIQAKAEELVALSDKARELVQLPETPSTDDEVVALDAVLTPLVARFREQYPAATVTVESADDTCVVTAGEQAVSVGLWNLLENTAEHNDTTSLAVEISVTADGHRVQVTIGDNGSGLPELEQQVLDGQSETPLQHGKGLGLWIAYWSVTTSGGEITVNSSDSEGTTVIVSLPERDPDEYTGRQPQ